MGRRQRGTFTIIACFFVLLLALSLSKKDEAPESDSFFESEEGILFFSDDEEQERIIAALSISSSSDDSDVGTHGDENRNKDTHDNIKESLASTMTESQKIITLETKPFVSQPNLEPKYEYLQLPDVYRVSVTVAKPHRTSKRSSKKPTNMKEPVTDHDYAQASPWVQNVLSRYSNDALLPVPRDFCMDNFNLMHMAPAIERIGIQSLSVSENDSIPPSSKPIYREALRLIIQEEPLPEHVPVYLQKAATALYLLIHQRFAVSPRGLDMMRRRLLQGPVFGRCPSIQCSGMPLLPYADSDNLNPMEYLPSVPDDHLLSSQMTRRCKRYCASCGETFYHWSSEMDGCGWGTSCCHLFLMVYGNDLFRTWLGRKPAPKEARIFGFRLHPSAHASQTPTTTLWNP